MLSTSATKSASWNRLCLHSLALSPTWQKLSVIGSVCEITYQWKKHQNTVFWVDINLALKKGLKFYQTWSNATILHKTLPAYCIPKAVRMEILEVKNEKEDASLRHLPKISLKHDWMKELGSEVAQRPDGQIVQQFKSSHLNQPNPNPDHERTKQPFVGSDLKIAQGGRKTPRSQEIETRSFHEEAVNPLSAVTHITSQEHTEHVHLMTARASTLKIKQHMIEREPGNEQSLLNEVNIDFRILGMPHSVVKQAQNSRVRELVKKIENHPHRHSLQRDLQPNEAFSPFSTMTKQMIQNVGNVRFFELFETDPKTQCTESLTVCMRHDEWGTKSRHLSHIVMCKESNEDDTKETLQTNKRHSRVFRCFFSWVYTCFKFASTFLRVVVLVALLCVINSVVVSVPTSSFLTCMWISCNSL